MNIIEVIEDIRSQYNKRTQLSELYRISGDIEIAKNYMDISHLDYLRCMDILDVYINMLEEELGFI